MEQNLSLYKIFNAVAAAGNISYAAKELYISQPAISKSITRLEENLGITLFTRTSRGVRLTEEGEHLYEFTKSAFDTLAQGEESIRKINELGIGHLRIGVSTTLCKYILLPYLKTFVQAYPHIKITIECQSTFETLKLLENRKIDVGLIGRPDSLKNLDFYGIKRIEDIFVTTKAYLENLKLRESASNTPPDPLSPLDITRDMGTSEIFKTANVMLLDENNMTRLYIDEYFNANHLETNRVLEVSDMDLLIEFARIGLGVSCVIKEFVRTELDNGSLIEIPLVKPLGKREVGFAYMNNTSLSDSVMKFTQFYKKV